MNETQRRMIEDGPCTWCEKFPRVATNEGYKCAGCAEPVGGCTCA